MGTLIGELAQEIDRFAKHCPSPPKSETPIDQVGVITIDITYKETLTSWK